MTEALRMRNCAPSYATVFEQAMAARGVPLAWLLNLE
jgi:hypothetical protein